MKLYFQESNGKERFLNYISDIEKAYSIIDKFLAERNYKSYYKIGNDYEDKIVIDVGSWSEFFIIYKE